MKDIQLRITSAPGLHFDKNAKVTLTINPVSVPSLCFKERLDPMEVEYCGEADAIEAAKQRACYKLAEMLIARFDGIQPLVDLQTGKRELCFELEFITNTEIASMRNDALRSGHASGARHQAAVDAAQRPYGLDEVYE